jgi:hypothetical protein
LVEVDHEVCPHDGVAAERRTRDPSGPIVRGGLVRHLVRPFLGALLVLICTAALAFGAGSAYAAPTTEPSPRQLWKEYPLEPLAGQPRRERVLSIPPAAVSRSSSSDRMLLIGGRALVVLILTDTVFLTPSSRVVR